MNKKPKVIDLFSGAGGLSLGAARAGFDVYGSVEIDPHASATHRLNFPKTVHIEESVSDHTGESLLELLDLQKGELDGVIGGPPCQGFSSIGKRDIKDPRNELFTDFFRIVKEIQPKFFLAENVPGILKKEAAGFINRANALVKKDYVCLPPFKISANNYGAPTTRTRVFFIGYKKDEMNEITQNDFLNPGKIEEITVEKALKGLPLEIDPEWQSEEDGWRQVEAVGKGYYESRLHGYVPEGVGDSVALLKLKNERKTSGCLGTIHSSVVEKRYSKIENGKSDSISKSRRLVLDGFCPTLRAGTGSDKGSFQAVRPLHPIQNRVITPREAARLQGFPDWFRFSPTKWHSFRQIGNSVSPILAERLFSQIITKLK
jgi:DNA (cytosine-5)-methyltransferase 1